MHNFDWMHWMKKFYAQKQNLIRTSNPEKFSSIGQDIFPQSKNNSF